MRRRALAGAGTTVGAVTAATALAIGAGMGHAQEDGTGESSAYAIGSAGLVNINETPHVESTDGTEQSETAVSIPGEGAALEELLTVDLARADAGDNQAEVEELNVKLASGLLDDPLVELSGLTLRCEGDSSTLEFGSLSIAGESFALDAPDEEQSFGVDGIAQVTAHQQGETEDGDYTAQGLEVSVLDNDLINELTGEGGVLTLTLASVTCGGPADDDDNGDKDKDKDNGDKPGNGDKDKKPEAPKPEPEEADLIVTG